MVNLDTLEARFDAGDEVTPEVLREHGLLSRTALVKVLARGELTKALSVTAHRFSAKAAERIAALGGRADVAPRVRPKARPAAGETAEEEAAE